MGDYDAFDEFSRAICAFYGVKYAAPPERPKLVVVDVNNAATFQQQPRRRGRPRKVPIGGNVVSIAEARKSRVKRERVAAPLSVADEIMDHFFRRLDERQAKQRTPADDLAGRGARRNSDFKSDFPEPARVLTPAPDSDGAA